MFRDSLGWKRELYQRLEVQEYWRFDPTGGDLYGRALVGERLVNGEYEEYPQEPGEGGSARSHSELLDVLFAWDGVGEFDVLDPETGLTIDKRAAAETHAAVAEVERAAAETRADAAETRADAAETRADAAEARADSEQARAGSAETRADAEREGRLAAEARVRQLEEQLRRQQGNSQ